MIVTASLKDLDQITKLHLQALGNTPNSQIGSWLIRKLYESTIKSKAAKVILYKEHNQVIGIISFALDLPTVVDQIAKRFSPAELCKVVLGMCIHPWTIILQVNHRLFMLQSNKYLPKSYPGIMTIAVDENYRRKNIGSKLIQSIDKFIVDIPRCIYVDTYTSNTKAINFYLKNGYHKVYASYGNTMLKKDL